MEDIKKLIEEINLRKSKNYEQMKIEEISKELHNTMEFEQNVLKKINLFENDHQEPDLIPLLDEKKHTVSIFTYCYEFRSRRIF